ncbi:MAG: small basic protein [Planctomycetota bacterium]|jgi:small basic protein (TIGR04137 family)|nr:MAG: small basic protein [Planctomycetota bacterium]
MSIHSSLKTKSGALNQHRNVLTRKERVAQLTESERFEVGKNSPLGLPKVLSIKVVAGKKPKKDPAAAGEAASAAKKDVKKDAKKDVKKK